jgi:hypothetical protein
VNQLISLLNVTLVIVVIIIGAVKFDKANWDNFFGPGVAWKGFSGVLTGTILLFPRIAISYLISSILKTFFQIFSLYYSFVLTFS